MISENTATARDADTEAPELESDYDKMERLSKSGDVLGLIKVLPEVYLDTVGDAQLMAYIKTTLHNSDSTPDKQHIVVLDGVIDFFNRVILFMQSRMEFENYSLRAEKPDKYRSQEKVPKGFGEYQMMLNCLITIIEKRAKLSHLSDLGKKSSSRKKKEKQEKECRDEDAADVVKMVNAA